MNLTNLFRRKKIELEIISKGNNIVEVKRYRDGEEIKPSVLAYIFSKKFVEVIQSYQ